MGPLAVSAASPQQDGKDVAAATQDCACVTERRHVWPCHLQFAELGLNPTLLNNLQRQGYTKPTPIQARSIPSLIAGRDLLGLAQTGTGKTAAFALPMLHALAKRPLRSTKRRAPRALVLAPTRELAGQVQASIEAYGRGLGLDSAVIFGGVGQGAQVAKLKAGIDILVATPGRLLDLFSQGHLRLDAVEILVLDEADRMLDMGFIKPIRQIVEKLSTRRQSLLFSATMPRAIRGLAQELLDAPVEVSVAPKVATTPLVDQYVCFVDQNDKPSLLAHVLAQPDAERVIVFTRTKRGADRVAKKMSRVDIEAAVIHGNKSQNARVRALDSFKSGRVRVLVATDVAARGIDVDGVSHVVNFDLPNEPESYVHRIGRTGRAGATGLALSFCDDSERPYLQAIERLAKKKLTRLDLPAALAETRAPTDRPTANHGPMNSPRAGRTRPNAQRRTRGHGRTATAAGTGGGQRRRREAALTSTR